MRYSAVLVYFLGKDGQDLQLQRWKIAALRVRRPGGACPCALFLPAPLLVIGLLTRVVAVQVVVFMFVAVFFVHSGFGYFWNKAGWEMPLMWMLLAIVVLIRGGGDFSIDKKLGKEF